MRRIDFRITYNDGGGEEYITVSARNINSGFTYALKCARQALGNGQRREILKIEFWGITQ